MNLYPSILTDSIEKVQEQLDLVKEINGISTVQIDIIDGFFADNLTVTPLDLVGLDFGDLKIDLHLMVEEPMDTFLEIEGLASKLPIRAVIAQIERMTFQEDFLSEVKRRNWLAGLSLDLYTPFDSLDKNKSCLQYLDIIQIMSIEAGFQNQKFNDLALGKIKEANLLRNNQGKDWEILVDGGVKLGNIEKIIKVGVTGVAVGSELWNAENLEETIRKFLEL